MRLVVLFLISFSLLGLITNERVAQTPPATDPPPVAPFVTHVRSISINGTDAHPVFDLQDVAVRDSMVYVLDQQGATLTAFTERGDVIYQVGRPGAGPGEFTNPMQVEFTPDGRLVILEGQGNYRMQTLRAEDGQSLEIMRDRVWVRPVTSAAIVRERGGDVIVTSYTDAYCDDEQTSSCQIQQHNLSTGTLVQRYGRAREIHPEYPQGNPWPLAQDEAGRTFVAHYASSYLAVYDAEGNFLRRFPITDAATYRPRDNSKVPADPRESFAVVPKMSFSVITHVSAIGDDIILDHFYRTPETGIRERYLSVFSRDGTHEVDGPARPAGLKLIDVEEDRFYFVETKPSELGSYVIHEYRYTGT